MKDKFLLNSIKQFITPTQLESLADDRDAEVQRKSFTAKMECTEGDEHTIVALVSSPEVDHEGDSLMPEGCDTSVYNHNPVIQWAHDYSQPPIGKCTGIEITGEGVRMKMKLANTPRANEVWGLVKDGFLKGCSVGFIVKESHIKGSAAWTKLVAAQKVSPNSERAISKWVLLENSFCPIGCNPAALVEDVSVKGLVPPPVEQVVEPVPVVEVPAAPLEEAKVELPAAVELPAPVPEDPGVEKAEVLPTAQPKPEIKVAVLRFGNWDMATELARRKALRSGKIL